MQTPLISIIIPAYNCARTLMQTLESALHQSYTSYEILLIDDCSTDRTASMVCDLAKTDPRIRVFRNDQNVGTAATRNRGFREARGEFIAFLDSDDLWKPDKLEKQLACLESTGGDICYTAYSFIDEFGTPFGRVYHVPQVITFKGLLRENVIGCSTVMLRREIIEKIQMRGDFAHEDYVFWLEAQCMGFTTEGIDEPLMQYRITPKSRSANKVKSASNVWRIYRNFLGFGLARASVCFASYAINAVRKRI